MFTAFLPLPSHCCFRLLPDPFTNSLRLYLKQCPKTKGRVRRVPDKTLYQDEVLDIHLKCSPLALVHLALPPIFPSPQSSREKTLSWAPENLEFPYFCALAQAISLTANALSSLVLLKNSAHPLKPHPDHPPSPLWNLPTFHPIACHSDPLVSVNHPLSLCLCSILCIGPL